MAIPVVGNDDQTQSAFRQNLQQIRSIASVCNLRGVSIGGVKSWRQCGCSLWKSEKHRLILP
ncbi:hypothetical protein BCR34DRAFT_559867 [Clohesyomyces aquaticus]|uniref:Uncharacterized protein n=1 Tax=Clohesyomyces aquaticus TaxID=1231657 RepID=A0A1Y1ZX13_9PLEO|nr:hypothetical protein BCR34DRAFT_559867 [Clohesyomyces aquaticus]